MDQFSGRRSSHSSRNHLDNWSKCQQLPTPGPNGPNPAATALALAFFPWRRDRAALYGWRYIFEAVRPSTISATVGMWPFDFHLRYTSHSTTRFVLGC